LSPEVSAVAESKSTSSRQSKTTQEAPDDGVARAIQKATDEAEEKGYFGTAVDPTDNEAYTLKGVTLGMPTPESDPEYAREVRQRLDDEARQR
jgi:NADPH-dependent glutamate synthase beta subunit-like oxidoreductase